MGRGRQKALAKKVARKVKYYSPDTNYDELVDELSANNVKSEFENLQTGYESSVNLRSSNLDEDEVEDDGSEIDQDLVDYLEWAKSSLKTPPNKHQ